jgi:hypothetical protein
MTTPPTGPDQLDLGTGIAAAFADEHTTLGVDAVFRRARRRRTRQVLTSVAAVLLVVAGVVGVRGLTAPAPVTPLPTGVDGSGAPTTFLAYYDPDNGSGVHLSLFDVATGRHLRDVMNWGYGQQPRLNGFSRAANGDIWLAEQTGPYLQSSVRGGDPRPHSCGGKIERIAAATGRAQTVVEVGVDDTVGWPVLSPDGRELAYLAGTCTGGFDTGVVVRDLSTGRQWRLQVTQSFVIQVGWGSDGQLIVVANRSTRTSDEPASGYLVTPAEADRTLQPGDLRQATAGCQVQSVAADAAGLLILQGCPDTVHDARLTQFDAAGSRVLWSVTPPATPNGGQVTLAGNGRTALVSTWSTAQVRQYVCVYDGPTLVHQSSYPDPPQLAGVTW